jgi:hypothetical protein
LLTLCGWVVLLKGMAPLLMSPAQTANPIARLCYENLFISYVGGDATWPRPLDKTVGAMRLIFANSVRGAGYTDVSWQRRAFIDPNRLVWVKRFGLGQIRCAG